MFKNQRDIVIEKIELDAKLEGNRVVFIKREDEIHQFVSGNKFRKLKYNILEAQNKGHEGLLTFGGAYSNHIAAVAYAGQQCGLKTIGIIRGDELEDQIAKNPTLGFAKEHGMQLHFISREMYRNKNEPNFIKNLQKQFGEFYVLPEGGTNALAVRGCEEILSDIENDFDYICTSVGTGGTMAGLINASLPEQTVVGFSALKGVFQKEVIEQFTSRTNFYLTDAYCFGGYAKIDSELIRFINEFKERTTIPLDPVYTGKMMFGIMDLLKKGYFRENSRILAIHTGGLQGIAGMNQLLKKKNLQQINL
jgi:1-aminocyclopropane-1-carboxylate deaminase